MSLIALDPECVVFDTSFVTSKGFIIQQPKGRWYPEDKMWVLGCGGMFNEAAYEEIRQLAKEYLATGVVVEHKNEELFFHPALITTPDRALRLHCGKLQEVIEPEQCDGILDRSWILCQAQGLGYLETFRVMSVVCPTLRYIAHYSRLTGEIQGAFDATTGM